MEVVVTTAAITCAKLLSNHYHQQTNTQHFYRPDALPVAQPTVSKHWREILILLLHPFIHKCIKLHFNINRHHVESNTLKTAKLWMVIQLRQYLPMLTHFSFLASKWTNRKAVNQSLKQYEGCIQRSQKLYSLLTSSFNSKFVNICLNYMICVHARPSAQKREH